MIKDYTNLSTNNDRFKALLSNIHERLLKGSGFKKNGQNFRLIIKTGTISKGYIINFQKSAWNTNAELQFTINIAHITVYGDIPSDFKEYDCMGNRMRLGGLAYGFDKWWSVTENADMESMEEELIRIIRGKAFSWMGVEQK